jgi:hypothetical protein
MTTGQMTPSELEEMGYSVDDDFDEYDSPSLQEEIEEDMNEEQETTQTAPVDERQETVLDKKELAALRNKLRAEAEREVIQNHNDEYHALAEAKFNQAGLEYTRRMTPEERAKREVEAILKQFPELRDKL